MRLFALAMLMMFSIGAEAKIDVQIANDGKFDGGTIEVTNQKDLADGVEVTITVTPNDGYTITKGAITVVSTYPPSGNSNTRTPEIAESLTLYYNGSAEKDIDDPTAKRDYTFIVPTGFGAWVKEATFQPKKRDGAKSVIWANSVYYINNNASYTNYPAPWYLWPSVVTNSSTGQRYLTTLHSTEAVAVSGKYDAQDNRMCRWVVKNLDNGNIQIISPMLNKYIVIRNKAFGDRDVWLDDLPTDDPSRAQFQLTNKSGDYYRISPTAYYDGSTGTDTDKYTFNSASEDQDGLGSGSSKNIGGKNLTDARAGLLQFSSGGTPRWTIEQALFTAPTISDVNAVTGKVTVTDNNGLPLGYNVRFTTDGTAPTVSSSIMGVNGYLVETPCTLKVVIERYGVVLTDVREKSVTPAPCATPVISFDYTTSMVSITCTTAGSTIHYTTNGSDPTDSSTEYSTPFSITSPTTVKAIATHATKDPSSVAELAISQVATPTIQDNGSNAISITSATPDATIYYTTDGSTPTTGSTLYTSPLTENVSNVTIKAIAVKENMITSAVGSGSVKLKCTAPVITRDGMSFTLSCSMPTDANFYYTIGSGSETQYNNSPVTIPSDQLPVTVTAVAKHSNYNDSESATFTFTRGDGTASNPYLIYGVSDFTEFVTNVNNGTTASKCYKLGSDVSASGIGAITTEFTGTFDGDGYTISGLTHPLFNTVNGGTVKNVTLKGVAFSNISDDYVGAIAGIAKGYTRIYNCGILPNDATFPGGTHPTVSTSGTCAGGIVGKLDGDSRVINCYSYADVSASTTASGIVGSNSYASTAAVTDDSYANLRTAVVNCMFYGNITGGTSQYGVYGGSLISNATTTGISSYNYYRNGSTFTTSSGEPTAYNCSFPAEERYLTQVEFHRSLLNSNRELCGWWVGSDVAPSTLTTTQVQAIPKDASIIYKWVVDRSLAPYPILKPFGKYASVINNPGNQTGKTLSVTVKSGKGAADKNLSIPITNMDTQNHDYGYYKVQLPYYNTVFGNPNGSTWAEKYAGNYTDQVVTGWKITAVTGGTQGSFVANWETGYNFADRKCTDKDKYDVSGRVFAQGGYYYVPDGVTAITIEAYWGKAIYVRNDGASYDRVNITVGSTGTHFAPAGTRDNNVNGQTIQATTIKGSLTNTNIDSKKTVYDYALVLVGNIQESVGGTDVIHATDATRGFTIMSADFDFDEEPDYCLEWQLGNGFNRQIISPIRFDFLPVVELGIAGKLHNSTSFYSLGCFRSKGHFEVTETAFIRFGQFEFELRTRDPGPIILNGGIYDQYCRGRNNEDTQNITYVILGGHIVMPSFTPGAHPNKNAKYQTRHCAVNALGGNFTSFYLTGGYNEGITPVEDNPHCYIDGGYFGTIAAAYKEGIWGDVTWRINHALIDEFYGGGVMSQATGNNYKIVKGNIDVVIDNSIVGKYCGGPKFGDMVSGKTVKTSATNTIFTEFYGAGNGGTNYVQYTANYDDTGTPPTESDWNSLVSSATWGAYDPGKYISKEMGYKANYDFEQINGSDGTSPGKVVNRVYWYSAQFATTNTGSVTNELTGCTFKQNFYGGGFLGGVNGSITSTLDNCTVLGSVFGAGFSASAGTVTIYNKDKNPPSANVYTGMIKPQSGGTSTTYYWTHDSGSTGSPVTAATAGEDHDYYYTEIPLDNLGAVDGNVILTLKGTTKVGYDEDDNPVAGGGHVYGGGDSSAVTGSGNTVTVNLQENTKVLGNVFGGGNEGLVEGSTEVNIE